MQRKAILAVLLLCSVAAWAGKRDKKSGPKAMVTAGTQAAAIDYKQIGAPLPPIRVVTAKGEQITDQVLKNDANLFVMMFNPTCEHCEDMTRALEKNIGLFKNSNIVLMAAPAMGPYLEYFDKNTNYTQFPSIKVGLDSSNFIQNTFVYESLPQINVYDKDRKLIQIFSGISTIDKIRDYIQ